MAQRFHQAAPLLKAAACLLVAMHCAFLTALVTVSPTGGYSLTESASGKRIIDNSGNFSAGSVSAISGQQGFCLPLG
jgi:hypothetical protein